MRATQLLERAVVINPHGIATICGERTRTWGQIGERVPRVASGLRSLGITEGVSVAILAMNSDYHAELFYAVPWAGGVFAPLNMRWSVAENELALLDSGAVVLIVDEHFEEDGRALKELLPSLEHLVYIGSGKTPKDMIAYESLVEQCDPIGDAFRCDEDLYVLFYTGGTTGHPKGVAMSHKAIVFGTAIYLAMLPETDGIRHLFVPGFFHLAAGNPLWTTTLAGGTNVILPKFDPIPTMEAIEKHRITNTNLVPTMISMLMNHEAFPRYDLGSLKTCIYGGSPMPESLIDEAMEKLPGWNFFQIYGMTETCGFATMLRWQDHLHKDDKAKRLRSAGQPAPCVEVKAVRPDGEQASVGELGEIIIRSDTLMTEYLNNPDQTEAALRNGWMHTGDVGYFDEQGYLYVADRLKDMIVTGGENVFSSEVERVLYKHPTVREAAVIGIPSEQWGEAVHAVIVLRDNVTCTEDEIIAHCRTLLGGYKVPKSIEFRVDPLPTTAVGKVRKTDLRKKFRVNAKTA